MNTFISIVWYFAMSTLFIWSLITIAVAFAIFIAWMESKCTERSPEWRRMRDKYDDGYDS